MGQADLAKELGVSEPTISNWETDKKTPTIERLILLADMGKVSLDWLILGKCSGQQNEKNAEIPCNIAPGTDMAKQTLVEQSQRATVKSPNLQLIVQWMDEEFGKHERQGLFFYDDIRDRYESFEKFLGKKRTSEGHYNRELEDLSDGTQG